MAFYLCHQVTELDATVLSLRQELESRQISGDEAIMQIKQQYEAQIQELETQVLIYVVLTCVPVAARLYALFCSFKPCLLLMYFLSSLFCCFFQNHTAHERLTSLQQQYDSLHEQHQQLLQQSKSSEQTYEQQIQDLSQQMQTVQTQLEQQASEFEQEKATWTETHATMKQHSDVQAEQGSTIESLTTQNTELISKVTSLTEAIAKYKAVVNKLKEKVSTQVEKMKSTQEQMDKMTTDLNTSQAEVDELNNYMLSLATICNAVWPLLSTDVQTQLKSLSASDDTINSPSSASAAPTGSQWWKQDISVLVNEIKQMLASYQNIKQSYEQATSRITELESQLINHEQTNQTLEKHMIEKSNTDEEITKLQETVATLTQKNNSTEEKVTKMKTLLLRANKHMDELKKKYQNHSTEMSVVQQRLQSLRILLAIGWLSSSAAALVASQSNNRDVWTQLASASAASIVNLSDTDNNAGANGTDVDASSTESGPLSSPRTPLANIGAGIMDEAVDVDLCKVQQRVTIDDCIWLLLSVHDKGMNGNGNGDYELGTEDTDDNHSNSEESRSDTEKSPTSSVSSPSLSSAQLFWTRQQVFLTKKFEKRSKRFADNGDNDTLDINGEWEKASSVQACTLFDGTVLPATLESQLQQTLNNKFEKRWNTSSMKFQRTLQEVTVRAEQAETALAALKEENTRYKARAQAVLAQQQAELNTLNAQLETFRTLQNTHETLKQTVVKLEAESKMYNPHAFELLKQELLAKEVKNKHRIAWLQHFCIFVVARIPLP